MNIDNNPCNCGCSAHCNNACSGDTIRFCEYGRPAAGCIRDQQPECPFVAVIPSVTVEDRSNIKDLADCFVHIANINTTIYIDDKHRMTIISAGPVEENDYDYEKNPLALRSQLLIDMQNGRVVYYNHAGDYAVIKDGAAVGVKER